jgi:hypothetical protein
VERARWVAGAAWGLGTLTGDWDGVNRKNNGVK